MSKPAARIGDMHVCPMVTPGTPPVPHVGGPISGPCVPLVLIGNMPAAVLGDMCVCVGPPDSIVLGSTGVLIGNKPAARMGDSTAHGGTIVAGFPMVLIGEIASGGPVTPVVVTPVKVVVPAPVYTHSKGGVSSSTGGNKSDSIDKPAAKTVYTSDLDNHIRKGDPTKRKSDDSIKGVKGIHSKDAVTVSPDQTTFSQGDIRIKPDSKNPKNSGPDEIYEAEPEIYGLNKSTDPPTEEWRKKEGGGGKSTFFPDSWSKEKIQEEIDFVRKNVTEDDFDKTNGFYVGNNSDGTFEIAIYINGDTNDSEALVGSAFPLL